MSFTARVTVLSVLMGNVPPETTTAAGGSVMGSSWSSRNPSSSCDDSEDSYAQIGDIKNIFYGVSKVT